MFEEQDEQKYRVRMSFKLYHDIQQYNIGAHRTYLNYMDIIETYK